MLDAIERHDPRAERWWEQVAVIRGRPGFASMVAPYHWLTAALRATVEAERAPATDSR